MGRFFRVIGSEKKLVGLAALIFVISGIAGYAASAAIQQMLKDSAFWSQLREIARQIQQDPSFFHIFGTIFLNNLRASVSMIGLGIFFGVFPIAALVTNGLMLGVVLGDTSAATGANPLVVFATSILPHGILELPAVIIAAAYGIRLGIVFSRWVVSWVSPTLRERSRSEWLSLFNRIPVVIGGIIVLLILAAVIESGLIVWMAK
ncbi:stage II sporulation protein M [Paludifilum halophilum]|nr:stage II sporulation protein M [Paludifilum halophilum]